MATDDSERAFLIGMAGSLLAGGGWIFALIAAIISIINEYGNQSGAIMLFVSSGALLLGIIIGVRSHDPVFWEMCVWFGGFLAPACLLLALFGYPNAYFTAIPIPTLFGTILIETLTIVFFILFLWRRASSRKYGKEVLYNAGTGKNSPRVRHVVRNMLIVALICGIPALPLFIFDFLQLMALWPGYQCIPAPGLEEYYVCPERFGTLANSIGYTMHLSMTSISLLLIALIEHFKEARPQKRIKLRYVWYALGICIALAIPDLMLGYPGMALTAPFKHCVYGHESATCTPPEYEVFEGLVIWGLTAASMAVVFLLSVITIYVREEIWKQRAIPIQEGFLDF